MSDGRAYSSSNEIPLHQRVRVWRSHSSSYEGTVLAHLTPKHVLVRYVVGTKNKATGTSGPHSRTERFPISRVYRLDPDDPVPRSSWFSASKILGIPEPPEPPPAPGYASRL